MKNKGKKVFQVPKEKCPYSPNLFGYESFEGHLEVIWEHSIP